MRPRFIGNSRAKSRIVGGSTSTQRFRVAKSRARLSGRDALRVDLGAIVSKYVGETERNIRRLFDRAEAANAVLYFDEADALFDQDTPADDPIRKKWLRSKRTIARQARRRGIPIVTGNASTQPRMPRLPSDQSAEDIEVDDIEDADTDSSDED